MVCSLGDLFFGMTLFYSVADLVIQWDRYLLCNHPINIWLLTSYANVGAHRMLQRLICRNYEELDDHEFFFSLTSSDLWLLKMTQYGLVFPALVGWTVLGTYWINDIAKQTPQCLPDDAKPWFLFLWIASCYVLVVFQILVLIFSLVLRSRVRQLRQSFARLGLQEIRLRWGDADFDDGMIGYGINGLSISGLEPEEILKLPSHIVHAPDDLLIDDVCSICLEMFKQGDRLRLIPECGHSFHYGCADLWLLRKAVCPNCKTVLNKNKNIKNSVSNLPPNLWSQTTEDLLD